jgi:transposase InsO family protein
LTTDASTTGIGYILSQRDDGGRERVISYGGRGLSPCESRYPITDLECLALVEGVKRNHVYLSNSEFQIQTDHISLTHLQKMKLSGNNRLTRWALFLQPYKFTITYKKGRLLTAPDAISRIDRSNSDLAQSTEQPSVGSVNASSSRVQLDFDYTDYETSYCAAITDSPLAKLPTLEDFRKTIKTCPDFAPFYSYLSDGTLPSDDQQARRIVLEAQHFVLDNGILYHLYTPRTKRLDRAYAIVKQLCVPTQFRPEIAYGLHDRNAHLGIDRLYATARLRYYFPGMFTFLRNHVNTCLVCQQAKRPIHPGKIPLSSLPVPPPCTRWHLDHHGPMPESNGKRYILVLIDSSSMWPELVPVEDTSAETTFRALFDHVISRFGLPRGISVLTDNGSAFISKLAALFCKTFGIRRHFTTPQHAQSNSRAEEFADTIHKSLRALSTQQDSWADNLQAVAMGYRASATSNLGLSPFEIIFGRPMTLEVDWGLLSEDSFSKPQEYAKEIAPKLEILHSIATRNAIDSAHYHRDRHNVDSTPPSYKVGDKVLLADSAIRRGESSKLKYKYTGPFIITDVLSGFNYRLQHILSGRDLRRPVHALRLRPLRELDNDYRPNLHFTSQPVLEFTTPFRKLQVKLFARDLTYAATDVILNVTDASLNPTTEAMTELFVTAGPPLQTACSAFRDTSNELQVGVPLVTTAGDLLPTHLMIHVVLPDNTSNLTDVWLRCISTADRHDAAPVSLALPFPQEDGPPNAFWELAHLLANAVSRFDTETAIVNGSLRTIEFYCSSILAADVLASVFRTLFIAQSTTQLHDTPVPDDSTPPPPSHIHPSSTWHEIESVLQRRKQGSRELFLVKWKGTDETSWVKRQDLSPAALQQFIITHPRRRRRRHQ